MDKNTDLRTVGPFRILPDASVFYASHTHSSCLRQIQDCLAAGEPNTLLTGDPGSGKSLLLLRVAISLPADQTPICLTYTDLNFSQLIAYVDSEVRQRLSKSALTSGRSVKKRVARWRESNLSIVLLLDDADQLPAATLRSLYELTQEENAPIQCVFSGSAEFATRLYSLAGITEYTELDSHVRLSTLQKHEIAPYLRYRLAAEECNKLAKFDDESIEILAHYAQGNVHKLNRLCQFLWHHVQATGQINVHASSVLEALTDIADDLDDGDPCGWITSFSSSPNTTTESWLPTPVSEEIFAEPSEWLALASVPTASDTLIDSQTSVSAIPDSESKYPCNKTTNITTLIDTTPLSITQDKVDESGVIYTDELTIPDPDVGQAYSVAPASPAGMSARATSRLLRHWSTIGIGGLCVIVAALTLPSLVATIPDSANATTPVASLEPRAITPNVASVPAIETENEASFFATGMTAVSKHLLSLHNTDTSNVNSLVPPVSFSAPHQLARLDHKLDGAAISIESALATQEPIEQPVGNTRIDPPSVIPVPIASPTRSDFDSLRVAGWRSLRSNRHDDALPDDKLDISSNNQSSKWSRLDCGFDHTSCDAEARDAFMSSTRR